MNGVEKDVFKLDQSYSKTLTNSSIITSVKLTLIADTEHECDIEKAVEVEASEAEPVLYCNSDGTYDATWDVDGIIQYGFSTAYGLTTSGVAESLESDKTYYYKVSFTAGCVVYGTFSNQCFISSVPDYRCNNDGTITIFNLKTDGVYLLNGINITPVNGEYIIQSPSENKVLEYTVGEFSGEVLIPQYSDTSCGGITYLTTLDGLELHVTVLTATTFPVSVGVTGVEPQIGTEGEELIFILPGDGVYDILITSYEFPFNTARTSVSVQNEVSCIPNLQVFPELCKYVATLDEKSCNCDSGTFDVLITNVVNHGTYFTIDYSITVAIPSYDPSRNEVLEGHIAIVPGSDAIVQFDVTAINEPMTGMTNVYPNCSGGICEDCSGISFTLYPVVLKKPVRL